MTYDYAMVGAGSAGCVLAARLSEKPEVKVALIEAGPPDTAQDVSGEATKGCRGSASGTRGPGLADLIGAGRCHSALAGCRHGLPTSQSAA